MDKDKHLGLRIDSDTHEKLKSLAEFDGRSINGEVLYLIRQAILQHEQRHGKLWFNTKKDNPSSGLSFGFYIFICFVQATASL